jgi:hypothetical protein
MMKQYNQMNREELENEIKELIERKEMDPDAGTVLFIDNSGAVILDRFEEPKYSVMQIKYKSIEEIIGIAKDFDPFAEIVSRSWLFHEVKCAYSNYMKKHKITDKENDFMTYHVGNA